MTPNFFRIAGDEKTGNLHRLLSCLHETQKCPQGVVASKRVDLNRNFLGDDNSDSPFVFGLLSRLGLDGALREDRLNFNIRLRRKR